MKSLTNLSLEFRDGILRDCNLLFQLIFLCLQIFPLDSNKKRKWWEKNSYFSLLCSSLCQCHFSLYLNDYLLIITELLGRCERGLFQRTIMTGAILGTRGDRTYQFAQLHLLLKLITSIVLKQLWVSKSLNEIRQVLNDSTVAHSEWHEKEILR